MIFTSHCTSTYFQFALTVRKPLALVPPAAVNALSAVWIVPLAIESHIASLPAVESLRSPGDASAEPSAMLP